MKDDYVRAAVMVRVIDGDTFIADVDLGFYVVVRMSCRILGINAPEHNEPGGPEAKSALATILGLGPLTVHSVRADKFAGRFDAQVIVAQTIGSAVWDVGAWMVERGYAVVWNGVGPKPPVPWPPQTSP